MVKRDPHEPVRAAGILLMTTKRPPQFLLMRHADRWDLPKGHSEADESFLETALRETQEETGIDPAAIQIESDFDFELTYPVTYKRSGDRTYTKVVRYFLGYLESKPELVLTEHESAQWFEWSPPHQIQSRTIDPLLAAIARHRNETS